MAPRTPESNRRPPTISDKQLVNRRIRVVYRRRSIDSYHNIIYHDDIECEGVLRLNPSGYGLTVLTDDGRSVGYFRADCPLQRDEPMPSDFSHMKGYDGHADLSYELTPVSDEVIPVATPENVGEPAKSPVMYYRSEAQGVLRNDLNNTVVGTMESYRVWVVTQNQWLEVTETIMKMLYVSESNLRRWHPQGEKVSTFYDHFERNFPGVSLGLA